MKPREAIWIGLCVILLAFLFVDNSRPTTVKKEKVVFNIHTARIFVESGAMLMVETEESSVTEFKTEGD